MRPSVIINEEIIILLPGLKGPEKDDDERLSDSDESQHAIRRLV